MNSIKIKNDKGEEKEYDILFDYVTSPNHTQYVVYTDFVKDSEGIIKCYSSVLNEDGKLSEITDEEQIKFIESTLDSLADMSRLKYRIEENE